MNSGAYEWFWMRVLGCCMIPIGVFLVYFIPQIEPLNAEALQELVTEPTYGGILIVTLVVFGFHSYLGMREVIIDYIRHPVGYKLCRTLLQIGLGGIVGGLIWILVQRIQI